MGDPMAKEYWYFVAGALVVLLPALLFVAVKKLHLLDAKPDQIITYAGGGGQAMDLHVFKARNTGRNVAPALLLFHGGAWMLGAPETCTVTATFSLIGAFIVFLRRIDWGLTAAPMWRAL